MRVRSTSLGLSLLVAVPIVSAAEDADAPRFFVRPRVHAEVVWDDNVYLQRRNERSDLSLRFRPGVRAEWNEGRLDAGVDVGIDTSVYLHESKLNETFGDARAWAEYEVRPGLTVRVADAYVPQPVRLGSPEDTTVNLVQTNTAVAEVELRREIGRAMAFRAGVRGSRFDTEGFPADVDLDGDGRSESFSRLQTDHWEGAAYAELERRVSRRAAVFGRLETRRRLYDDIASNDFLEVASLVGARIEAADRLTLEAAVGYGQLEFDELDDDSNFVGRLEAEYRLPRQVTLIASARRTLASDAVSNDFAETSANLGIEKRFGRRTYVYLGGRFVDYDTDATGQRSDRAWGAELRVTRQLTRRLAARLSYHHWNNGGSNRANDFEQNRVILGLDYRF